MGLWKRLIEEGKGGRRSSSPDLVPMSISSRGRVDLEKFNSEVKKWSASVAQQLRSSARWFDGKDGMVVRKYGVVEKKLKDTISYRVKNTLGQAERISFGMARHGVFVHKGVGRGYQMHGDVVVRTAKSDSGKYRVAVEWFNPVLDQYVPRLADRLAELDADAVVNATNMRIN